MSNWRVCFGPSDLRWTVEADSEEDAIHQAMGMFVVHYLKGDNFHAMPDESCTCLKPYNRRPGPQHSTTCPLKRDVYE